MAAFWGEVLPVSSRAVFDDDDDEEEDDQCQRPIMQDCSAIWNPSLGSTPLSCDKLIVADGEAASLFVEGAFLSHSSNDFVGILNSGFVETDSSFPPKSLTPSSKSCTIHYLKPGILLVKNTSRVFPEQLHSWHNLLFQRLLIHENTEVIILSSSSCINYLEGPSSSSLSSKTPPFLRSLVTSHAAHQLMSGITQLETPNVLEGVVADLLTFCEVQRHSAAAFVVFAEARLEASTVFAFLPLLASGGCLSGILTKNQNFEDFVHHQLTIKDSGSLLYT